MRWERCATMSASRSSVRMWRRSAVMASGTIWPTTVGGQPRVGPRQCCPDGEEPAGGVDEPGPGGGVDDVAAVTTFDHARDERLDAVVDAVQVDPDHPVPPLVAHGSCWRA